RARGRVFDRVDGDALRRSHNAAASHSSAQQRLSRRWRRAEVQVSQFLVKEKARKCTTAAVTSSFPAPPLPQSRCGGTPLCRARGCYSRSMLLRPLLSCLALLSAASLAAADESPPLGHKRTAWESPLVHDHRADVFQLADDYIGFVGRHKTEREVVAA